MQKGDVNNRVAADDQRITSVIMGHWEGIKKGKAMPSEHDLDPTVLEQILDSCYLVGAVGVQSGKYDYKYIGKNVVSAYESEETQRIDYEKGNPLTQKNKIIECIENKRPISDEGEFVNTKGEIVRYRQCIVPLSNDGVNVDSILGGIRYKIFPQE